MAQYAKTKRVDQRIAFVRFVKIDLPGDGRDAEAVAIMGNACHHAAEKAAVVGEGISITCRRRREEALTYGWLRVGG